jgi:hypothetical protein
MDVTSFVVNGATRVLNNKWFHEEEEIKTINEQLAAEIYKSEPNLVTLILLQEKKLGMINKFSKQK